MRTLASFSLLFLINGLLLAVRETIGSTEVSALMTFKEAIFEDPNMVLSKWNGLASDPCDWDGILCSFSRDHVIKINITGASIKGFLVSELGQLTSLQELVLHGNKLLSVIPKELSLLKDLRVLDLGKNELTGPIPPEIGNLTNVVKINLESNALTGHLPPELGNLKNLQELKLDRNRLRGTVPARTNPGSPSGMNGVYGSNVTGLCRNSQLKKADFSYNFFVGSIPKCLAYLSKTSFQGNCLKHEEIKQRPKTQCDDASGVKEHPEVNPKHRPSKPKHEGASKPSWLLALEIATGVMVGSLFLVALYTAFQRCNSKSSLIIPWKKSGSEKEHMSIYVDTELLKDVVRYTRQDLEVACEDFSNIIGSSPDSLVYKGNIRGGPEIAVISLCIKEENWTSFLELYFQREVADLARLNHENAGKLLGYCRESAPFTRMLVFEYASNGTLYEHLHYGEGEGCQLSWSRRMRIVIGIARGLKYLHSELDPPFTISELNSSAVYLTEDFSPKLVDFECWKAILARSEKYSGSFDSQGAVCLLPNSLEARHLDVQGNIYAFGVLLLEIISGRPPYSKEKGCLVDWAKEYLELPEVMSSVVDPELKNFKQDDLKVICEAVSRCLHPDPSERPRMHVLCDMLESGIDTTFAFDLKSSSLAWAELALSS